jgi:Amidohydrolase family
MYDLVLKGGRIYDGSGMPSFNGDVAVAGGQIVEIGRITGNAKRMLNLDGLALAPGFIDPHTHLDAQLLWDPLGTSSCFHGVTSAVIGNCGLSLAPAKPEDREAVIKSFVRVEAISRRVLEEGVNGNGLQPRNISTFSESASASTLPPSSAISRCAITSWEKTPWSARRRQRRLHRCSIWFDRGWTPEPSVFPPTRIPAT